jgi:hypothetical protein
MLKDLHTYKDFNGNSVSVMGKTKNHEEFVYSLQGNWYLRTTGQKLFYSPKTGEHRPHGTQVMSDIDMSKEPEKIEDF